VIRKLEVISHSSVMLRVSLSQCLLPLATVVIHFDKKNYGIDKIRFNLLSLKFCLTVNNFTINIKETWLWRIFQVDLCFDWVIDDSTEAMREIPPCIALG